MIFFRLLPLIFSVLLLAAHFLRFHGLLPMAIFLMFLFLLVIRKMWVIRFWQVVLSLGTLLWIDTTFRLIQFRIAMNQPWLRMAIIMGVIIFFTAFSGIWLESRKIKDYYRVGTKE